MLDDELRRARQRFGARTALISARRALTYEQLAAAVDETAATEADAAKQRVAVALRQVDRLVVTLAALDRVGATAVLLPASATEELCLEAGVTRVIDDDSDRPLRSASRGRSDSDQVVLLTSGTSGPPKMVSHTWKSLSAAVHRGARYEGARWFTGYEPTTFAGLQVVLQALLTGGCLVLPGRLEVPGVARALAEHAVEYASATPSYWRMFLAGTTKSERKLVHLRQITMGGEAVDQPLLDALHRAFPTTRLGHIYASTEMGACFAVTDGRAGFPRTFLDDDALPCQLAISADGELMIRPGRGQEARDALEGAGWFSSGDLVEVDEDRVRFVGRREDCINVGGRKVFPVLVEDVIRSVDGVREVRVRPLKSSLLGQLVAAEVEASPEADQAALRTTIIRACRMRLPRHAVPAEVTFIGRLERTPSGKVARGPLAPA